MDPSPPSLLGEWDMDPELIMINTINYSEEPVDVRFLGEFQNSYGERVGGTDQASAPLITIPPGEFTFSGSEVIPTSAFIYEDNYQKSIWRTGMLPEDFYSLCVDVTDPFSNQSITEYPGCSEFFILVGENPYLIYPYDEAVINIFDLTNTVFQWSPVFFESSTSGYFNFRLVIVEVLEGQQPEEALLVNDFLIDECLYIDDPQFLWPEGMISLQPGEYAWSVVLVSDCEYITLDFTEIFVFDITDTSSSTFYGEEIDDCSSPSYVIKAGTPISLGMVLEDAQTFKYPRAVALRAEGVDWDIIDFLCAGCEGGVSNDAYPVRDQVTGYKWKLDGKGTLNTPPDMKEVDSLQNKLKELQDKLSKINDTLSQIHTDTTKTLPDKIAELEARLDDAKRTRTDLDSLAGALKARRDSLNAEFQKALSRLQKYQRKIDSLITVIDEHQIEVDSLENIIAGESTDEEKTQQLVIKQIREELERLKEQLQQKEEDILTRSEQLTQDILDAENNLKSAAASYNQVKGQLEAIALEVTLLETQMMSDPDTRRFLLRQKDWKRKSLAYIQQFVQNQNTREGLFASRRSIQDLAWDAISVADSDERTNGYNLYLSTLQGFNNTLSGICNTLDEPVDDACRDALANVNSSSGELSAILLELVNSNYLFNRKQQETIDSLRRVLKSMEATLGPVKDMVEEASEAYEEAVKQYIDEMEQLQVDKYDVLQQLGEIEDQLAPAERALKDMIDRREADLDNNMVSYLERLHSLRIDISSANKLLESSIDSVIVAQNDTLTIGVHSRAINSQLTDIRVQISRLDEVIKNLEKLLEKTRAKRNKANEKAEELTKDKENLEKEIKDLKEEIKKKLNPKNKKEAEGPMVYYIPPPLEEVLQKPEKFDSLKNEVVVSEEELKAAYQQKEAVQGKVVQLMDKVSKNLVKYKRAADKILELEKKIREANDDVKKDKTRKAQEFLEEQQQIQEAIAGATAKKDSIQRKLEEYLRDSADLKQEIERYKDLIKVEDSLLTALRNKLLEKMDQLKYEKKLLRNATNTLAEGQNELTIERTKLSDLKGDLSRAQNDLTRANALGDDAEISNKQDEIEQLKSDIKLKEETQIPSVEQKITSATSSVESAQKRTENALKQKEDAFKEYSKIAGNLDHLLRDSLKSKNEQMEEVLSGLVYQRKRKDKAQKALDKANKDREETRGDIENRLNEDEEIKKKQKSIEELQKELESLNNEKTKAENDINAALAEKNQLINEANEALKNAKQKLKNAKKELRDYLKDEEFNVVSFEVNLELEADDKVYDAWRYDDDQPEKLVKTLRYPFGRQPLLVGGNTYAEDIKPEYPSASSICIPKYFFKKENAPEEEITKLVDKNEPRTIALIYKNGEPLWPEWPVIPPDAPLLAKDIVRVKTAFTKDSDNLEYMCITDADCTTEPPVFTSIFDLGTYLWSVEGRVVNKYPHHSIMFWETNYIPTPKIEKEQIIEPTYLAVEIAGDDPAKGLTKPIVKVGVMIETLDEIRGVPDTAIEIRARVVTGDHIGLDGEEIEFEAELIAGESEGWGFDGGNPKTTDITKDGGYAKPKFEFGDGFAEFKIMIKWKRDGKEIEKEETKAKAPIKIQLHRFGSGAPEFAWEATKKLFEKGGTVEDAVKDFPSSTDENSEGSYAALVHGIAGLLNAEKEFVNEEKALFEVSDKKITIDPEDDETELFGIGRTTMSELPEEADIDLTTKVEDKYKDVGEPAEDSKSYSTKKAKEFKIGSIDNPFIVIMDEEFSPQEPVNGTGKLQAENVTANQFIREFLGEINISAHDVELEGDEELVAIAGVVSWVGEAPIKKSFAGIEITLDSLVITASMGAGLGGTIKKDSLIPNAIQYYAELEPDGNFLGRLDNLPSVGFKGFKLKEGSSFSIDMHGAKSPDPFERSFKGVIIHSATLELPESFSKEDGETPALFVKDFYVGSRFKKGGQRNFNLGGEVSYEGTLLKIGFAGYDFAVNKVALTIDDNEVKSGEFVGELALPIPMEGKVKTTVKSSGDGFAAEVATDNPVAIPRLGTTLTLLNGTGVTWDANTNLGTFRLNAFMVSGKFGEVEVNGIEVNSKGEIKADEITIEKAITFGSGFDLHVDKLGFKALQDEYGLSFKGGFSFERIGIDHLAGTATIAPGPIASVVFENAEISFDRGPVSFNGSFAYAGTEFKGKFDIGLKKILPQGISGMLVVGNMKDPNDILFNYWYSELSVGTKIPLGQTGLSVLQLGGGLGYNYLPPVGSEEGSPSHNDFFSLKAIIGIGNVPGGEIFAGRMEMVLVPGKFTLYGKTWLLDKEESMFGEGRLDLQWEPVGQVSGYVRMFVGIPDANGGVLNFNGKINFLYSSSNAYIRSETITGAFLKEVKAEGSIDITSEHLLLNGKLGYELNKTFSLKIVSAIVDIDVEARGKFEYYHINKSLNANASFDGSWDVDMDTPVGTADIISGSVSLYLGLKANPSFVEVEGSATVSYDIWFYSGSAALDVGYSANL